MDVLSTVSEPVNDERLIGVMLKEERLEKGISMSDLVNQTKIRSCHLVALEQGDYDAIPGGEPYVRGFLRSYAKGIGADEDRMLRRYHELRDARLSREQAAERSGQARSSVGKSIGRVLAGGVHMTVNWLIGE